MKAFPKIMCILNATPDSFSDGDRFANVDNAVEFALHAAERGVDIIDIGGESTRPGSEPVGEQEELDRVIPIIEGIRRHNANISLSIDTYKSAVAHAAVKSGANIVNDISAGTFDDKMFEIVANLKVPIILMHTPSPPRTMQMNAKYTDVVAEVKDFLSLRIQVAEKSGINEIIIDPGIGFGKNYEQNIELIRNIDEFGELNRPILLGISRKSFLGQLTGIVSPAERDIATILLHSLLLRNNIEYIRIHNFELAIQLKMIKNEIF
ncbi:MAG: dihydropteroate synthase [Candidatus Kapabacteria bacterium]|nr:dihydropteroate synthase [Candidatus Kapabacteria bacterium]